jgi:protocatechuate 3,4-dioxygenase beta subunit
MKDTRMLSRRETLARVAAVSAAAAGLGAAPVARGASLGRTPSQGEGPYYPVAKPRPAGNDLLHGAGGALAEGRPLSLTGRVLDTGGAPLAGARVEIWQCDNRGIYRHPRAPRQGHEDPSFLGYGESEADTAGRYAFLTIVPVPYTGRPPHIHAKIFVAGREALTTQLYLMDHPQNARDGLLSRVLSGSRSALMIAPRAATLGGGFAGETASFDFVV